MSWYIDGDLNQRFSSDVSLIVVKLDYDAIVIPVDPAGDHCYWGSTKPCESRGFRPSANGSVTRG